MLPGPLYVSEGLVADRSGKLVGLRGFALLSVCLCVHFSSILFREASLT